ncbi:MAG: o-succinylbenzoate synthase [Flavobacteriales bacterium]|nr:o-succinylbenzoate synthase [Flavobacteriales bacterium]
MNPLYIAYDFHPLKFFKPATTSRDTLTIKPTWFIQLADEKPLPGVGEISIIEGLSVESERDIHLLLSRWNQNPQLLSDLDLTQYPSVQFALEMCAKHRQSMNWANSDFAKGVSGIDINGLVWMSDVPTMRKEAREKIEAGFKCVKLKIGAQKWEDELDLISNLRKQFNESDLMIRVDANGAFSPDEALGKLQQLADLDIHSIEQPIAAGQIGEMHDLCSNTPLPIALDEELIGCHPNNRANLLDEIKPQYIILKPSLVGGLAASDHWVSLAEERSIGWWVTSALESNIGLNAIAQWVSTKNIEGSFQGLGTGKLYSNNISSPLEVREGQLHYTNKPWELPNFLDI